MLVDTLKAFIFLPSLPANIVLSYYYPSSWKITNRSHSHPSIYDENIHYYYNNLLSDIFKSPLLELKTFHFTSKHPSPTDQNTIKVVQVMPPSVGIHFAPRNLIFFSIQNTFSPLVAAQLGLDITGSSEESLLTSEFSRREANSKLLHAHHSLWNTHAKPFQDIVFSTIWYCSEPMSVYSTRNIQCVSVCGGEWMILPGYGWYFI